MSDNDHSDRDPPPFEPSPAAGAPRVEPPRLELLPYAAAEQARRAGLSKAIAWGSAGAAALAIVAAVAAFGFYDHARQANVIALKTAETQDLADSVKALEKRIGAIEVARAHDESADMRKVADEMKSEGAAGRELSAGLAQATARLDKLEHDHTARLDKLTDRLDHETAGKFADLAARLDKLEKHPLVAAAAPIKPALPAAKPTTPSAQPVSDETTGAIERPPLRGYWLVEAQDGYAVIDGRDGPQQVAAGDILPGLGRVQRIERRGGGWVVRDQRRRHRRRSAARLRRATDPDDDVDAGDRAARRRGRRLRQDQVGIGDIDQGAGFFDQEMMVRRRVGVEIGARAFDRDLAQQPGGGELVQGVVDGRQRHRHLCRSRLLKQHFGRDMAVAAAKQQPAERDALAGRPQLRVAQLVAQHMDRTAAHRAGAASGGGVSGGGKRCGRGHGGRKLSSRPIAPHGEPAANL